MSPLYLLFSVVWYGMAIAWQGIVCLSTVRFGVSRLEIRTPATKAPDSVLCLCRPPKQNTARYRPGPFELLTFFPYPTLQLSHALAQILIGMISFYVAVFALGMCSG
jgi:hypothetical protein